jgi:hypothetical protein
MHQGKSHQLRACLGTLLTWNSGSIRVMPQAPCSSGSMMQAASLAPPGPAFCAACLGPAHIAKLPCMLLHALPRNRAVPQRHVHMIAAIHEPSRGG